MIRHLVFWNIKDGYTKDDFNELINASKQLSETIPGIVSLELMVDGLNTGTHQIMLNGLFESETSLAQYQVNPNHLVFGKQLKEMVKDRVCFDYIEK